MGSYSPNTASFFHQGDDLIHVAVNDCRMQGRVVNGVANFLGVPYASIPARFSKAQILDQFESSSFHDATNYGPRCPQPVDVPRTQRQHLYEGIQQSDSLSISEFECLNLNIYTPAELSPEPVPVLVWIHGGGFVVGDGGPEYGKHRQMKRDRRTSADDDHRRKFLSPALS